MSRFVVVGTPGCPRVHQFQAALVRGGLPPATIVPWLDLIAGRVDLREVVRGGDNVRIESPGRAFEVERALLVAGADDSGLVAYEGIPRPVLAEVACDKGRILAPKQWYLGLCRALREIERQLAACAPHMRMNDAEEIAVMFDKPRCHARLSSLGLPVAPALGSPRSYGELLKRMHQSGRRRVFVKLAHGSSASGVVAYESNGSQHRAITTTEVTRGDGNVCLYNSRRLLTYEDPIEVAALVDALCRHGVHVEAWLAKAGIEGCVFDLRVLVIAGQVAHVVPRLARSPLTNLHLLNRRGDPETIRARMPPAAWESLEETCRRVARAFPRSLHVGIDVAVLSGFRQHAILEVNAFGDQLNDVLWRGMTTYEAEIAALSRPGEALVTATVLRESGGESLCAGGRTCIATSA